MSGRVRWSFAGQSRSVTAVLAQRPECLASLCRRHGINRARGEEHVPRRRGRSHVERVAPRAEFGSLARSPLLDALLGVGVEEDLRLAVAQEHHLVVGRALRLREGPAVDAREVRRQVPRRDRQPLPWHDEDEQAVLRQVPGAVREEGVLDALLLPRVPVVRGVQVEETEGAVGDRGGEEVGAEHVVEAVLRLFRAFGVKLHAVRLHLGGVRPPEGSGQPFQRLAFPQQGSRILRVSSLRA